MGCVETMALIHRIQTANRFAPEHFLAFKVAGQRVGFVKYTIAQRLVDWPQVFSVDDHAVTLVPALDSASPETRTRAVHQVLLELRQAGLISGWRDEAYRVNQRFSDPPLMLLERAAVPLFGVCGYGVHLNGYVRDGDGLRLWVARRSLCKPTAPGKLDQLVGGGQPANLSLAENLVKECAEEASIPAALAHQARPVGTVSYCLETHLGLRPDILFNYDLQLPADFIPHNADGEVEDFQLLDMDTVSTLVRDGEAFKFNCALVVIDFLIRHGLLDPQEADYPALVEGLRARATALSQLPD